MLIRNRNHNRNLFLSKRVEDKNVITIKIMITIMSTSPYIFAYLRTDGNCDLSVCGRNMAAFRRFMKISVHIQFHVSDPAADLIKFMALSIGKKA